MSKSKTIILIHGNFVNNDSWTEWKRYYEQKGYKGRYKDKNSRIDVKIFEDKSHFICGEPGWEKVADYILAWYES
jgi:hypothetical protein